MKPKHRRAPASILLPVAFCVGFAVLFIAKAMPLLPKGEQLLRVASPGGDRVVNAYLCDGGATVDYAIRCEVEGRGLIRRNLYWQYHASEAAICWLDNDTVSINGIPLNVRWGCYDYRRTEVP